MSSGEEWLGEEVAVLEELVGGLGRVSTGDGGGQGGGGGGGGKGGGGGGRDCLHQIHQLHQLLHQLRVVVSGRPPHPTTTLVTLVREVGRLLATTVEAMLAVRVRGVLGEEEEKGGGRGRERWGVPQ